MGINPGEYFKCFQFFSSSKCLPLGGEDFWELLCGKEGEQITKVSVMGFCTENRSNPVSTMFILADVCTFHTVFS